LRAVLKSVQFRSPSQRINEVPVTQATTPALTYTAPA